MINHEGSNTGNKLKKNTWLKIVKEYTQQVGFNIENTKKAIKENDVFKTYFYYNEEHRTLKLFRK